MRTHGLAEVNLSGEGAIVEIDDIDGATVCSGHTDAGVAVDRDVSEFAVGRDGQFVAIHANIYIRERASGAQV